MRIQEKDSGAAPPPVPPRRTVTRTSVGNRDRSYRELLYANRVPVNVILLMIPLGKGLKATQIASGATKPLLHWLSLRGQSCPFAHEMFQH